MVRLPVAGLLVLGGIFSFLPVLGIWMLPLGLLLFAQDLPILEKPMAKGLGWIERRWRKTSGANVRVTGQARIDE